MELKKSLIHEDPRMPVAAERTFLAWIRTGLAHIGFGLVVARFGLFLREWSAGQNDANQTAQKPACRALP